MRQDIILDLETLGKGQDAVILSIGAVKFSKTEGIIDTFYMGISLANSFMNGLKIDEDTYNWWQRQDPKLFEAQCKGTNSIAEVVNTFEEWIEETGTFAGTNIWGNGPEFDNAKLKNLFKIAKKDYPMPYWSDRCVRTILDVAEMKTGKKIKYAVNFEGDKHNPVCDAIHEAKMVLLAMKELEISDLEIKESYKLNNKNEKETLDIINGITIGGNK